MNKINVQNNQYNQDKLNDGKSIMEFKSNKDLIGRIYNHNKFYENNIDNLDGKKKLKLLLHVCCAPCSSHVLEYLESQYDITTFYYNPNINTADEYRKRINELRRLLHEASFAKGVGLVEGDYDPIKFIEMSKDLEEEEERGRRCYKCYELRLIETVKQAKERGFDIFTTTLSVSPHKDAAWLNEIGMQLGDENKISYLYSDFKKENGYIRSIQLSKQFNLYRQNYCGCRYSKRAAELKEKGRTILEELKKA